MSYRSWSSSRLMRCSPPRWKPRFINASASRRAVSYASSSLTSASILLRHQPADRRVSLNRENSCLPDHLCAKADGHVSFLNLGRPKPPRNYVLHVLYVRESRLRDHPKLRSSPAKNACKYL